MAYNFNRDQEIATNLDNFYKKNNLDNNVIISNLLKNKVKIELAENMFIGKVSEELKDFEQAKIYYSLAANAYTQEAIKSKSSYALKCALNAIKSFLRFSKITEEINLSSHLSIIKNKIKKEGTLSYSKCY